MSNRIESILDFLTAIDALKEVERRTYVGAGEGGRRENDAEHTWHMCMFALLLHREIGEPVNMLRVLPMILVHDLVEIYAGDTFAYDAAGQIGKAQREEAAAKRLFALLPPDLEAELHGLWREFEELSTPEAHFSHAVDRMQAFAQNVRTGGRAWREHGITREQVRERNAVWNTRNESLAALFQTLWEAAEAAGTFAHETQA
ncbi:MAG: HD domain-containing protein [Bacilli bacterium]